MLIAAALLAGYFIFPSPEPCPRKYQTLQKDGGAITNYKQTQRYCELDYGLKWVRKKGLKDEEDNN